MFFIYTADTTMPFSPYSADASMKEGNIVVMKFDWCAVNNVLNTSVSEAKVFRFANVRKFTLDILFTIHQLDIALNYHHHWKETLIGET